MLEMAKKSSFIMVTPINNASNVFKNQFYTILF